MAFTVTFWTFGKRERSTARPGTRGDDISCIANSPLDLLAPVLSLEYPLDTNSPPTVYNYAYIAKLSRYYWVTDWEIRDGLWWVKMRVDPLASWKDEIGAHSCYVFRSSYTFNPHIEDTLYPTLANPNKITIDLPRVWTVGGANAAGTPADSGLFIISVVTSIGTKYYAMDPGNFSTFMDYLLANTFYEDVLGRLGIASYPEAKIVVNPLQFITSCVFIPMGIASTAQTSETGKIKYDYVVTHIGVAGVPVPPANASGITAYELPTIGANYNAYQVQISSNMIHPQASVRGDWLNYSPYNNIEVFYPPFGLITLDPVEFSSADRIRFLLIVDSRSTMATLQIQAVTGSDYRVIATETGNVGIAFPLSNVITPGSNVLSMAGSILQAGASAIGAGLSGNYLGAATSILGGAQAAIGQAVKGRIPHASSMGGPGNPTTLYGQPALQVTQWLMADDDNPGRGRPLCEVRQFSNIPGYIMADSDEIYITGATETELQEIRSAVSEGFYYA